MSQTRVVTTVLAALAGAYFVGMGAFNGGLSAWGAVFLAECMGAAFWGAVVHLIWKGFMKEPGD